jgi:hypothetical protein
VEAGLGLEESVARGAGSANAQSRLTPGGRRTASLAGPIHTELGQFTILAGN